MISANGERNKFVPTSALLALVAAALVVPASCEKTRDPFYIVAHMANNQYSLDWVVKEGANAIELDLQFDGSGNPTKFEHGGLCDCSCVLIPNPHPPHHICHMALGNSCHANNDVASHLSHLALLPGVALVLIDSKVDASWGTRLRTAGSKVVALLEDNLFARGYRGSVVISAAKINCYDYVYSAALAAAGTPNKDRYYFTFDQEGNNYQDVVAVLSKFTRNRAFGTGTSACLLGDFKSGINQAVSGFHAGQSGLPYIWILDKESSMETYIDLGVQGILTNKVALLRKVAVSKGLRIATPEDRIPPAIVNVPSPNKCDCNYHKGGCTISFPAPEGTACRCKYKGFFTCGGDVVACREILHEKCSDPDASKEACLLGGGDCGGY